MQRGGRVSGTGAGLQARIKRGVVASGDIRASTGYVPTLAFGAIWCHRSMLGRTRGAATGGLMALGLLGADEETAVEFQRRFRARAGAMDCRDLLEAAQKQGEEKKPHCDRVVALAVALVDELTAGKER